MTELGTQTKDHLEAGEQSSNRALSLETRMARQMKKLANRKGGAMEPHSNIVLLPSLKTIVDSAVASTTISTSYHRVDIDSVDDSLESSLRSFRTQSGSSLDKLEQMPMPYHVIGHPAT